MLVEIHSAESYSDVSEVINRKRYADLGVFQGHYQHRLDVVNACRLMLQDIKGYSDKLALCSTFGIKHTILVDVDKTKLFYVDKIYFRLVIHGVSCDICINLKDTLVYKIILNQLQRGVNPYSIEIYSKYWKLLYKCVISSDSRLCGWSDYLLGGL